MQGTIIILSYLLLLLYLQLVFITESYTRYKNQRTIKKCKMMNSNIQKCKKIPIAYTSNNSTIEVPFSSDDKIHGFDTVAQLVQSKWSNCSPWAAGDHLRNSCKSGESGGKGGVGSLLSETSIYYDEPTVRCCDSHLQKESLSTDASYKYICLLFSHSLSHSSQACNRCRLQKIFDILLKTIIVQCKQIILQASNCNVLETCLES